MKQFLNLKAQFLILQSLLCVLATSLAYAQTIKAPKLGLPGEKPKNAEETRPTGLETEDYQNLGYAIYIYAGDSADLDEASLAKEIEQKISQNSLTVADANSRQGYLSVELTLIEEAFNLSLKFKRLASYTFQKTRYESEMIAWELSGTGIYDGDAKYILKNLQTLLDKFITQYSQANQEKTNESK